jgi:hypothetical protein
MQSQLYAATVAPANVIASNLLRHSRATPAQPIGPLRSDKPQPKDGCARFSASFISMDYPARAGIVL